MIHLNALSFIPFKETTERKMSSEVLLVAKIIVHFWGPQRSQKEPIVDKTDRQKLNIWSPNFWYLRRIIGRFLSRNFYLPLYRTPSKAQKEKMQKKIRVCSDFLNPDKPVKPRLFPYQEMLRQRFEQNTFTVIHEGLTVTCPVLKTKSSSPTSFKVLYCGGNLTTGNNALWHYPWVASYCDVFKQDPPPIELYLFSVYEVKNPDGSRHEFDNLHAITRIAKEVLKKIGEVDLAIGHSIGALFLMLASSHLNSKHVCLDRGFSSIAAMSQNYWHGRVSLYLARFSGWDADPAAAICKLADKIHFTLFSAEQDPLIKKANYFHDSRLKGYNNIKIAVFHLTGVKLHTTRIDGILKEHLIASHTTFDLEDQNALAKQVVINSLRSKGCEIPKSVSELEKKDKS